MSERIPLVFFTNHWQELIPAPGHFLAPLAVLFVLFQFWSLSQLLPKRLSVPIEVKSLAVWGGVCLVMTLWGVYSNLSLLWPTLALMILSALIWIVPSWRPDWREAIPIVRVLILMAGLFLTLLTLRPSSLDSFFNLLPNSQYLWDFGRFPDSDLARTDSSFPALPYNTQLVGYLSSWFLPFYPTSAVVYFNVFVQGFFGLFLARIISRASSDGVPLDFAKTVPRWSHIGIGILLATAISPGFRLEYLLADHGEASTMVTVGFAAWLAIEYLTPLAKDRDSNRIGFTALLYLGLLLTALVNIRQSNIALVVAVAAAILALSLFNPRTLLQSIGQILLALILPLVLWLSWRGFVNDHFVQGELAVRSIGEIGILQVTTVIRGIFHSIAARPFMFLLYGGIMVGAVVSVIQFFKTKNHARLPSYLIGFAVILLVWNCSLVVTYLAVEDKLRIFGATADEARSYYRYNSHLILLGEMVILLAVVQAGWLSRLDGYFAKRRRLAQYLCLGLFIFMAISPLLYLRQVRYDLQMPRSELWRVAHQTAERIKDDDRLAIVMNGDFNDSSFIVLRGLIAMTEPRRAGVKFSRIRFNSPDQLPMIFDQLRVLNIEHVLLLCSPSPWLGIPARSSGFYRLDSGGFKGEDLGQIAASLKEGQYWAKSFKKASFCL
ncbi:MAG: hypothetical protein QM523_03300 [Candidatus Pacebacteria bacterium]|nr:hypothetical protein [Candidatus Paceibacterota bacterium]